MLDLLRLDANGAMSELCSHFVNAESFQGIKTHPPVSPFGSVGSPSQACSRPEGEGEHQAI